MNELLRKILFLPEQASNFSYDVDQLHYFVIITTMIVSTAVGLGALFFFARYRRRRVDQKTPHVSPPWWMEALFIVVPLTFFLVWFAIGYRQYLWIATPPKDAMDVYVMGKQWMWKYTYAEGPNSIATLRVPVNRPVRLLLTSRDVIHSFYVPAFRIKQDVIPGRYTQAWFSATKTGRFPMFCAEYCGLSHSSMFGEVVVMEGEEFDSWMADQKRGLISRQDSSDVTSEEIPADSSMVEQGRQLSLKHGCVKCHSQDGSAHLGPTWMDLYHRQEKLQDGSTVLVDEAYMTESMMDPRAKLVAGFQPVMPSFNGQLTPPDIAAIIEYIKSLRSDRFAQDGSRTSP
jgi:cytochrome c oxidase subunit 2